MDWDRAHEYLALPFDVHQTNSLKLHAYSVVSCKKNTFASHHRVILDMFCSVFNENVSASFKPQQRKPTTQLQSQCSFNKVDNKTHSCEHVKDAWKITKSCLIHPNCSSLFDEKKI